MVKTAGADSDPAGCLIIVPTPIGNLADISFRAVAALGSCDLIAAEDTRHTGILLKHYSIETPQLSLHEHNEASRSEELIARLRSGASIALVSDAGTPLISDPGSRLVRRCIEAGISVEVLPGPCAAICALVGSGFDLATFRFGGFLPHTSGRREKILRQAAASNETVVFYESPYRLLKSLQVLEEIDPGQTICVARELTKKFEEIRRGTPGELLAHFGLKSVKGEICLVVGGSGKKETIPPRSWSG